MSVKPHELENPERGMNLTNRETEPETTAGKKGTAAELKALRERIASLRAAPVPTSPKVDTYSRDWHDKGWKAGWAAALEAIEKD